MTSVLRVRTMPHEGLPRFLRRFLSETLHPARACVTPVVQARALPRSPVLRSVHNLAPVRARDRDGPRGRSIMRSPSLRCSCAWPCRFRHSRPTTVPRSTRWTTKRSVSSRGIPTPTPSPSAPPTGASTRACSAGAPPRCWPPPTTTLGSPVARRACRRTSNRNRCGCSRPPRRVATRRGPTASCASCGSTCAPGVPPGTVGRRRSSPRVGAGASPTR